MTSTQIVYEKYVYKMHPVGVSLPYPLWLRLALGATRLLLYKRRRLTAARGKGRFNHARTAARETESYFVALNLKGKEGEGN